MSEYVKQPRRKYCQFCKEDTQYIDYKDTQMLRKYVTDRGKIKPRRVTGACTQHQRDIANAVKRAREMALMPYAVPAVSGRGEAPQPRLVQEDCYEGNFAPRAEGKGIEGDVVEVANGFANNYLLPKKMAVLATKGNLKQLEQRRHNIEKREADRMTAAEQMKAKLEGLSVQIDVRVGEEGQLFGSVTTQMIADALLNQHGVEVDKKLIDLKAPSRLPASTRLSFRCTAM